MQLLLNLQQNREYKINLFMVVNLDESQQIIRTLYI